MGATIIPLTQFLARADQDVAPFHSGDVRQLSYLHPNFNLVLRELVCVGDRREWNISTAASPTLTGVRPRGFNPDMGTWLGIHTRSGLRRHRRHLIIGLVGATNPLETEERHLRSQRWPRRFGVTIIDLTKSNKTDHKSTNQLPKSTNQLPQIYKSTTQIYKSLNLEAANTLILTWSIAP